MPAKTTPFRKVVFPIKHDLDSFPSEQVRNSAEYGAKLYSRSIYESLGL